MDEVYASLPITYPMFSSLVLELEIMLVCAYSEQLRQPDITFGQFKR